ncbi:MAG TPA: type IV toxin-antitoxin system AbiEi family antitoxin domain-containing protein, partial [Actinopolymorphaceae bacterium]|nr:type IV toxin-antitoxin system AbiEi family antitoxin domain-containing protein [Actinopolymorphaceae bacterium]
MAAHRTTLSVLAELAEEQWGLFTRRQAEATGMAWSTLARLARSGVVERVAYGLYRLRGAPPVDHLDLRAAWLQLVPDVPAWERTPETGVVSHRSAASVLGLGHLPADTHEFTLPGRR